MRINKYVAGATGLSRRAADNAIVQGRVLVNGHTIGPGYDVQDADRVTLDNGVITPSVNSVTIMLNKPAGYVCSRAGQGSRTIYDLLPTELHRLKPIGRLDKDSTGLLLLTDDGELANQLTHPRYQKEKIYEVELNQPLSSPDESKLAQGVQVEDYVSRLGVTPLSNGYRVRLSQGRNRQIRRTFTALGYEVRRLHRTHFGPYKLDSLAPGRWQKLDN